MTARLRRGGHPPAVVPAGWRGAGRPRLTKPADEPGDCTCPDHANGAGGGHWCKHRLAVEMARRAGHAPRPAAVASAAD